MSNSAYLHPEQEAFFESVERSNMNKTPVVWITGAAGLIGSHLLRLAPQQLPDSRAIGLTRSDLDLADHDAVRERFNREAPSLVIHCAAMSRSPDCEANPTQARAINVEATRNLVTLSGHIPLIFFSSDLLFDGKQGSYKETDPIYPIGIYAETKAEAEQLVLANPLHTVVRTSLNTGPSPDGTRGFDESMRRAWAAGKTLKLFTDEYRCPIPAAITAAAVWELVRAGATGLFHLAGSERLSRWQIAELIAQASPELQPLMEPVSRQDYQGPPRPADTSLDCSKIAGLLSFPLPRFSDWVNSQTRCL
jgi:dTDP-4-dehydrorhamnose reductase